MTKRTHTTDVCQPVYLVLQGVAHEGFLPPDVYYATRTEAEVACEKLNAASKHPQDYIWYEVKEVCRG